MKRFLSLLLIVTLVAGIFAGCGALQPAGPTEPGNNTQPTTGNKPTNPSGNNTGNNGGNNNTNTPAVDVADDIVIKNDAEMFTDRDLAGTYEDAQTITLGNEDISITKEGTYILSGTLNGMITVNVTGKNDKVQLVLNGVTINSTTGAGICVLDADKVFITLVSGTKNTVEVGKNIDTIEGYEMNAAIYSRSDLTINGSGSLTVIAPAGHGVSSKDDLVITGGTISVTCANQALDANDSIRIADGNITIDAGKDGIHAEHTEDGTLGYVYISGGKLNVEAEGDGISASSTMQLSNVDVKILAGGGYKNGNKTQSDNWGGCGGGQPSNNNTSTAAQSMKGLKSEGGLLITSGTFVIDSADDAIHSNGNMTIEDGTFTLTSGDDGVHAENILIFDGGKYTINECYEGLEAAYVYVRGGEFYIDASDDGINAAGGVDNSGNGNRDEGCGGGFGGGDYGKIEISGGKLTIYSGGDALDSNGDLRITGGYTEVFNPRSGDTSILDSDNKPVITGGTYIGLGIANMMFETFNTSSSTQGFIYSTSANIPNGVSIVITDADGNEILRTTTQHSTKVFIISCPEMVKGKTYTLIINGSSYKATAN